MNKNETKTISFDVFATKEQSECVISSQIIMDNKIYDKKLKFFKWQSLPIFSIFMWGFNLKSSSSLF